MSDSFIVRVKCTHKNFRVVVDKNWRLATWLNHLRELGITVHYIIYEGEFYNSENHGEKTLGELGFRANRLIKIFEFSGMYGN